MNPSPDPLRLPRLAILRIRNPVVFLLHNIRPRQRRRWSDIDLPAALPWQGLLLGQHVQIPKSETRRHALCRAGLDGRRQFQETEVRRLGSAGPDTDEFGLGHDEAVPALVVAHVALQMGETEEVEDFFVRRLDPHAGVPALVGLDDADDATFAVAEDHLGDIVFVVGDEAGAITVFAEAHRDVAVGTEGDFEGGIYFDHVEVADEVDESQFGLGSEGTGGDVGLRKGSGVDGNAEKFGEAGDFHDCVEVEVFPCSEVADVPPKVRVHAATCHGIDLAHNIDGGVGTTEVVVRCYGCFVRLIAALLHGKLEVWRSWRWSDIYWGIVHG